MFKSVQLLCISGNPVSSQRWSSAYWSGGACFSSQESRYLARLLHCDSLPEYTQIRPKWLGKIKKWTKTLSYGLKLSSRVWLKIVEAGSDTFAQFLDAD